MTAKIDLLTLQLFVAIVEEQSIAKAAERKNIAASAVSRRISDIEELFQVELLHRHIAAGGERTKPLDRACGKGEVRLGALCLNSGYDRA